MKIKENKGITLIALVITIIVLLILAGVTINMVLGDNGIIGQAQGAKTKQTEAEEKQAIKIATGEARTSEYMGTLSASEVNSKLSITGASENAVREIRQIETSETNNTTIPVPIPKGMAYAFGTVDEGVVVVDGDGNEFVWVPVNTENTDLNINKNDVSEVPAEDKAEEDAMKVSVAKYKGFYVGRYETSWTGSKVASLPNVTAYNNVIWTTFKDNQAALYTATNSNVGMVSDMIYGSQWEAILNWMSNVPNPNVTGAKYNEDSTGMGNYNLTSAIPTGSNNEYKVKNIYDLAGNYGEWTQQLYDSFSRNRFGGSYDCYEGGCNQPASNSIGYGYTNNCIEISSRLQLYIK